jgi:hypothetical protein
MQPALIPRRSVLVQNTLLHALIQRRNRLTILLGNPRGIPFGNGLAECPKGPADVTLISPINCGTLNCLTGALQRRNMVCHRKPLAFFKLEAGGTPTNLKFTGFPAAGQSPWPVGTRSALQCIQQQEFTE